MGKNVLELRDVFLQRDGKMLLNDLTWKIAAGEHWALLGANGSGKTLTLKLILGFLWPTRGQVEVLGNTYGKCDIRKVRPSIGWVNFDMQYRFITQALLVEQVVVSSLYARLYSGEEPLTESDRAKVKEVLLKVGLPDYQSRSFSSLSYGEQKRVLLARALIHSPRLLILDEPCTGLDIAARESFLADIAALTRNNPDLHLVFVTHHTEELLPFITHAMLLCQGKVLSRGTLETVLTSKNLSQAFEMNLCVERSSSGRYLTRASE